MSIEDAIAAGVKSAVANEVGVIRNEMLGMLGMLGEMAGAVRKIESYGSNQLLLEEQVAQLVGVKKETLQQWRHQRKHIPFIVLSGKAVRYQYSDVLEYIMSKRVVVK